VVVCLLFRDSSAAVSGEPLKQNFRSLLSMRAIVVSLVLVVIPFFLGGCRQGSTKGPLPEITSESEEGFHDLVFAIEDHKKLPDGSQTILTSGMYKGRKVSLEIDLGAGWRSSPLDADVPITTYQGSVSYRSVGAESDRRDDGWVAGWRRKTGAATHKTARRDCKHQRSCCQWHPHCLAANRRPTGATHMLILASGLLRGNHVWREAPVLDVPCEPARAPMSPVRGT